MAELLFCGDRCAAVVRGRRVLFGSWLWQTPVRLAVDLPPGVGRIVDGQVDAAGLCLIDSEAHVHAWDAESMKWTELGEVREPDPPAAPVGPRPGARGALREPASFDGPGPALIRCRALGAFCIAKGIDCVPGDEVLLSFERARRLSRAEQPLVEIIDHGAMREAEKAAERAYAAGRG